MVNKAPKNRTKPPVDLERRAKVLFAHVKPTRKSEEIASLEA